MKDLTDNVRHLSSRIDNLESKTYIGKINEEGFKSLPQLKPHAAVNDTLEKSNIKKNNFKEKFMKNINAPNYESLLVKHENVTTYVGKPGVSQNAPDAQQENKSNSEPHSNEKQAYVNSVARLQNGKQEKIGSRPTPKTINNSWLRKLGEFFK
jgi:hypothetical protein